MSSLWTSAEIAKATGGHCSGHWGVSGISIDTRSLQPEDLFVALKDQRDGHDFVADALNKGASGALVSRVPDGVEDTKKLIIVDDVLQALADLAVAARARTDAKVIGVTGSVGKTSTKEMLRAALAPSGHVHAAERSFNNHWGVPLTLARMPKATDFAVIEIGMNAPGEIAPLAKLAALDVAMITTVAAVHLEAFDNVEGIAREKAAIFDGLKPRGTAIINADFETRSVVNELASALDTIWFGRAADADPIIKHVQELDTGQSVEFLWNGLDQVLALSAVGDHFAVNAMGVLAAVKAVGGDAIKAMAALGQWGSPPGRGEQIQIGDVRIIDESYNANPTSMDAALKVLAATQGTRKLAILGDMLELGAEELTLHAGLADFTSIKQADLVHTVGARMKALHDALPSAQRGQHFETVDAALIGLDGLLLPGDAVMIKGSKGSGVHRLVAHLKAQGEG